jgi:hypothetical protein
MLSADLARDLVGSLLFVRAYISHRTSPPLDERNPQMQGFNRARALVYA